MEYYEPPGYNNDTSSLLTIYGAYIPNNEVGNLADQIMNPESPYFTAQAGISAQLANFTVPDFPIDFSQDSTPESKTNQNRRDIIIAVCSIVGVVVLLVLAWWRYNAHLRNRRYRDGVRRRLHSDRQTRYAPLETQEVMVERTPSVLDISPEPAPRGRRDSFYFANDALRPYLGSFVD